ncbi:hypothetical protein [Bradyrhizobium sp. SEMIA]|uniref:hypothetical protein n=1 Tax=Bradyrhizobium sp. SEMIA TaxID=2597515 RepID=UPI0018A34D32|nr:hypothetical protein [Bradyrhizobium sp. SEMIA]QOG17539.1 hypothetical protein FOM02_09470 [Bradyrhizobium sp. SEMIA]
MLTVRLIAPDDYAIRDDGHSVGRIRLATERSPAIWVWHITVTIPDRAQFGDAATLDEAKGRFRVAWEAFKAKHGAEALAKAYAEMGHADWAGRYRR